MCKSWCEALIALVVIIFVLWETTYSKWILLIAGVVLLIHSFTCKKCFAGHNHGMMMPAKGKKK